MYLTCLTMSSMSETTRSTITGTLGLFTDWKSSVRAAMLGDDVTALDALLAAVSG